MKIILFSRPQLASSAEELRQLFEALRLFGFDYALNAEFAAAVHDTAGIPVPEDKIYAGTVGAQPAGTIMVCYGGDGTLLEGVHRLGDQSLPVMGINAGHLGFLTSAPNSGLHEIFERIASRQLTVEARTLLEVAGDFPTPAEPLRALNEFTCSATARE